MLLVDLQNEIDRPGKCIKPILQKYTKTTQGYPMFNNIVKNSVPFLFLIFAISSNAWAENYAKSMTGVTVITYDGISIKKVNGWINVVGKPQKKLGWVLNFFPGTTEEKAVDATLTQQAKDILTAVSGKTITQADWWESGNKTGSGNTYKYLPRSSETYAIDGINYVIVTYSTVPYVDTTITDEGDGEVNTRPSLNNISSDWDAEVGQSISIPLSVVDNEGDEFTIKGSVSGSKFSEPYTADNGLQTVDFLWTPNKAQVNKVYTLKFTARESGTVKHYTSNTVTTKIRVWPAGGHTDENTITKFSLSTASWKTDSLTITGKVEFAKVLSPAQKSEFLSRALDLNLSQGNSGTGKMIGTPLPLTIKPNGTWTLTNINLPQAMPFSCQITAEFDGRKSSRKISRAPRNCIK